MSQGNDLECLDAQDRLNRPPNIRRDAWSDETRGGAPEDITRETGKEHMDLLRVLLCSPDRFLQACD